VRIEIHGELSYLIGQKYMDIALTCPTTIKDIISKLVYLYPQITQVLPRDSIGNWCDYILVIGDGKILKINDCVLLVDMRKAVHVTFKELVPTIETAGIYAFKYKGITNSIRVKTSDISDYGCYGSDPRVSTPEFGKEGVNAVLDYLEEFAHEFVKMKI